jgi:hypothetical protein
MTALLGPRLTRRRIALAVLALLAAAGVGAWAWWPSRPAYRLAPGDRLVYTLDYTNISDSDFTRLLEDSDAKDASSPLKRTFHATIEGELVVTVLGRAGDNLLVAYHLQQATAHLASDGQLNPSAGETLRKELAKPVFAEVEPAGRIVSIRLAPGLGSLSKGFARAILAATQILLPASRKELAQWTAEEEDTNGLCEVSYESTPAEGGRGRRLVYKTRQGYRKPQQQESFHEFTTPLTVKPEGTLEAQVDLRKGELLSLAGTETTTAGIDNRVLSHSETTLKLELERREAVPARERETLEEEAARRARSVQAVGLSVREDGEAGEAALQRTELGEATLETLLTELDRAEKVPAGDGKETSLYLKFKALIYLHPGVCARLGKRLEVARPGGATMRILAQALSTSDRPAAQKALAGVITARRDEWLALAELIPAAGLAKAPGRETEAVLRELARARDWNMRSTAQLSLGSMARTLAQREPERAGAIVRWAVAELEATRDASGRRQWLLVLGNTGAKESLPAVRKHLGDPDPRVRSAAVGALRWHPGVEIDEAICQALTSDSADEVRQEATGAYDFRPMTAKVLEAHARALRADRSAAVRLAVLKNLDRARKKFPTARALIQQAASKDPDKDVRERAAEMLKTSE